MIKKNDIARSKADDFLRNGGRAAAAFFPQARLPFVLPEHGCIVARISPRGEYTVVGINARARATENILFPRGLREGNIFCLRHFPAQEFRCRRLLQHSYTMTQDGRVIESQIKSLRSSEPQSKYCKKYGVPFPESRGCSLTPSSPRSIKSRSVLRIASNSEIVDTSTLKQFPFFLIWPLVSPLRGRAVSHRYPTRRALHGIIKIYFIKPITGEYENYVGEITAPCCKCISIASAASARSLALGSVRRPMPKTSKPRDRPASPAPARTICPSSSARDTRRSPRKQINASRSNINSIIETKRAGRRCSWMKPGARV